MLSQDGLYIDEEPHPILVFLIFQGEIHIVGARWDQFHPLEEVSRLPILVVYPELHARGCFQEEQEPVLSDLIIG
jgi:hypothetical protein